MIHAVDRMKALEQAVLEVTGTELKDHVATVSLAQHAEHKKAFREQLSKHYPGMTNRQSDEIARLASTEFWPGVRNWMGNIFPEAAARDEVRVRQAEILDEVEQRRAERAEQD